MEIGDLRIDARAAESGIEVDLGICKMTLAFASLTNKTFQVTVERLLLPHRRSIEFNMMDPQTSLELNYRAYAECIVKGWSGLTRDGVPVPFSSEECFNLFKSNPRVFEAVQKAASDDANFRAKTLEASGKNSPTA